MLGVAGVGVGRVGLQVRHASTLTHVPETAQLQKKIPALDPKAPSAPNPKPLYPSLNLLNPEP